MTKRRNPNHFLSSAQMRVLVRRYFAKAAKHKVKAALCGGLAMHLYGSDRLTKDIDFMADGILADVPDHLLSFGGASYDAAGTPVDWIVRDDQQAHVYQAALDDRVKGPEGFWIIRPEWLALIKFLARRDKDELDLRFLLKKPGLVDRAKLLKHVKEQYGRGAYVVEDDLRSWFDEADWAAKRDKTRPSGAVVLGNPPPHTKSEKALIRRVKAVQRRMMREGR